MIYNKIYFIEVYHNFYNIYDFKENLVFLINIILHKNMIYGII